MKKIFPYQSFLFFIALVLFYSCDDNVGKKQIKEEMRRASNGGALHIGAHQNDIESLDLHNKLSHQNLLRFGKTDMRVEPLVFHRWFEDIGDTSYTFIINPKFQEVKAEDVVFSLWLSYLKMNDENEIRFFDALHGELPSLENINDTSLQSVLSEFSSIKIKNDSTISFKLVFPIKWFPELLASANIPLIKYSTFLKSGTYQGIGPFVLVGNINGVLQYSRNNDFLSVDPEFGESPYLDSVLVHMYTSRNQAISDFKTGVLDLLYGVPVKQARTFVEDYISDFQNDLPLYNFDRFPEMSVYYYHLFTTEKLRANKKLRQAISLGINRDQILKDAIFDEAYSTAKNGMCPPIFRDYDQKPLGFLDTDETEAGYFFDSWKRNKSTENNLELSISVLPLNDKSLRTGLEIQRQLLKKYDVQAELNEVGGFENSKNCDLSFGQVKAYFNSPVSVLMQFLPYFHQALDIGSQVNPSIIEDAKFKESVLLALATKEPKEHATFCLMAEKVLLEECLVSPLWYGEKYRLIKSKVKNFKHNRFNVVDFGAIYLD